MEPATVAQFNGTPRFHLRRRVGQGLQPVTNPCVERGVHPRLARVDLFDHGVREGVTRDERTTDEVGSTSTERASRTEVSFGASVHDA